MIRYNSHTQGYTWLSNFFHAELVVTIDDHEWTFLHVEGAYQCLKQAEPVDWTIRPFLSVPPPLARKMGKDIELRPDWTDVRVGIMTDLCRAKFTQCPALGTRLLATGEEDLVHLSPWDRFWGVDNAGHGFNEHGLILMQIRDELRRGQVLPAVAGSALR